MTAKPLLFPQYNFVAPVRVKQRPPFAVFLDDIMTEEAYLSSDELRTLTKCGSSFFQSEKLAALGIPHSFDPYGTPMVKRSDLAKFLKEELQPLFDMMKMGGGNPA